MCFKLTKGSNLILAFEILCLFYNIWNYVWQVTSNPNIKRISYSLWWERSYTINEWEKGLENDCSSLNSRSLHSLLWSSLFFRLYFSPLYFLFLFFLSLFFLFISSKGGARMRRSAQRNNILHHEGNSFHIASSFILLIYNFAIPYWLPLIYVVTCQYIYAWFPITL